MRTLVSILMLGPVMLITSCATTGYERASQARSAIDDARAVTAGVQQKLEAATGALQKLSSTETTALRPPYDDFSTAVESLGVQVKRLAQSDLAIQKRNNAYVATWQEVLKGYQNADVRNRSAQRLGEVTERFRQLKSEFMTGRNRCILCS